MKRTIYVSEQVTDAMLDALPQVSGCPELAALNIEHHEHVVEAVRDGYDGLNDYRPVTVYDSYLTCQLKMAAVEWVTADHPDNWYQMSWEERAALYDELIHAVRDGDNTRLDDLTDGFVPTEAVQAVHWNWPYALEAAYECLCAAANLTADHLTGE